jgi:hypothetical protein
MKKGRRALWVKILRNFLKEKPLPKEKPPDKLRAGGSSSSRGNHLEQENYKSLKQKRLHQDKFFCFERAVFSCAFALCAIVLIGDFPLPLRLGAAATLWYILKELIKHMTNRF